jgi:tetratricopeptide (TPR) repeat protein
MQALVSGRFEEFERLAGEALEIGQEASEPNARHYYGIQLATLRYFQGRLEEIEAPMRAFVDQFPNLPTWRCTLALLYCELGQMPKAQREFDIAGSGDWADFRRDGTWLLGICRAADACARLGDTSRAPRLYELLLPYAERNVVLGRVATIGIGSASRYLGLLAASMSRWDEAVLHLEAARSQNERMGLAPWRAMTDYDYALALISRDEPGDGERATELLADSLETANRLGMGHLAGMAESVRV